MVCEPVSYYHERPAHRLARLADRIAAARGAPIEAVGHTDLLVRNTRGERQRIMQADQILFLHPARTKPQGNEIEVGTDALPEVVLEVDNTTDVRRGKLRLYEAWGFPEAWVEVPDEPAASRPAALSSRLDDLRVGAGGAAPGAGKPGVSGLDGGRDTLRVERAGAVGGDRRGSESGGSCPGRGGGYRTGPRSVLAPPAPRESRQGSRRGLRRGPGGGMACECVTGSGVPRRFGVAHPGSAVVRVWRE